MTPHLGRLSQRRFLAYLEDRVRGGVGLVISPAGSPVYTGSLYDDAINYLPAGYEGDLDAMSPAVDAARPARGWASTAAFLAQQAEIVHATDALIVGQIHHPGAERSWDSFQPSLAPSGLDGEWPAQHPHELSDHEIDRIVDSYVTNAELIMAAGFDGVEVHAAHGYLLNRFLSPAYNRRTGRFGGSTAGRWAILVAILSGIRSAIGSTPLLGVRVPAFEELVGGLEVAEVVAGLATCSELLDYVNVSLGTHDGLADAQPVMPYTNPWLAARPDLLPACGAIKAATGLPVMVTGGMVTAAQVGDALASGQADLVGIARAAIADPRFAEKVIRGDGAGIVECIGCNECVMVPFSCPVNPAAGREQEFARSPAPARKRVVVVGGGPAGLSAGLALAGRGHEVLLYEQEEHLGGRLHDLVADPVRARWRRMLDRLVGPASAQLTIALGARLAVADVEALAPDAVIVATGANAAPTLFGSDGSVAEFTSVDVLKGRRPAIGTDLVVAGGTEPHLDPLLTARLLAAEGWAVRLISELPVIGAAVEPRTLHLLLQQLHALNVTFSTSTRVTAVADGAVTLRNLFTADICAVPVGAVVLAHSRRSEATLAHELAARPVLSYVIGDALAPRRLTHAVLEGARFGVAL